MLLDSVAVSVEDKRMPIDSRSSCQALFDKSSAQTSERPRWIVSNEQLCNRWNVLLLPASDARWKVSPTAKQPWKVGASIKKRKIASAEAGPFRNDKRTHGGCWRSVCSHSLEVIKAWKLIVDADSSISRQRKAPSCLLPHVRCIEAMGPAPN